MWCSTDVGRAENIDEGSLLANRLASEPATPSSERECVGEAGMAPRRTAFRFTSI